MKKLLGSLIAATLVAGCGAVPQGRPLAAAIGTLQARHVLPLSAKVLIDGQNGGVVTPGRPSRLGLQLSDPQTGKLLTEFEKDHEKPLHLILVRADLSSFAHLHPDLGPGGAFSLGLNQPTADPDNQDAQHAVQKPGTYFLFAEAKPAGRGESEARATLVAAGQEQPAPLIPDKPSATGEIVKYFTAQGAPGKEGDAYKITVTVAKMRQMVHFNYNIQALHQMGGMTHYMAVKDLENWLGMPGHAVLVGQSGEIGDRVFRHMHAGHGDHGGGNGGHGGHDIRAAGAGPDLMFMLEGDEVPPAGIYRVWGQLKHKGKILTLPVTLQF